MNHLEFHLDLGPAAHFPLARESVFSWALQDLAGVVVRPSRRVVEGQIVALRLNPGWPASPRRLRGRDLLVPVGSCVVTRAIDADDRAGFTYRTLPGHLEDGEETFLVSIGTDGRLAVTITADSVPAHPLLRLGAPATVAAQEIMARRYAEGLKRQLSAAGSRRHGRALASASAISSPASSPTPRTCTTRPSPNPRAGGHGESTSPGAVRSRAARLPRGGHRLDEWNAQL